MPKNKQKKIVCVTCKEKYNPQRYGSCPACFQVGLVVTVGGNSSHTPQAIRKYDKMGLLNKFKYGWQR